MEAAWAEAEEASALPQQVEPEVGAAAEASSSAVPLEGHPWAVEASSVEPVAEAWPQVVALAAVEVAASP